MLSFLRQSIGRHTFVNTSFRRGAISFARNMSSSEPVVKEGGSEVCPDPPVPPPSLDHPMEATAQEQPADRAKRPVEQGGSEEPAPKLLKSENGTDANPEAPAKRVRYPKKKVAMMLSYSGVGYQGMQINPGTKTIEGELLTAFYRSGSVPEGCSLGRMNFQRASRTDKGVSAAGQVVSLKMLLLDNLVEKLNEHLPPVIRVMDFKRTTQSFNSKQHSSCRSYIYLLPTYSFQDVEEVTTDKYRITDEKLNEVNDLLSQYKGTHNYHNFTSGKLFDDMSANRYIMEFSCQKAFEDEGMEFALMRVKGQSFMLHQIRKMIGLIIAITRGFAPKTIIERAFGGEKLDIPRAPGLGLVLEAVHFDWYDKKWGGDDLHEPLTWESVQDKQEAFKKKHIFPNIIIREKYNRSMMHWMSTLPLHSYDVVEKHNPMRCFLGDEKDKDGNKVVKQDKIPDNIDLAGFKSGQTPEEFLETLPREEDAVSTANSTEPDQEAPPQDGDDAETGMMGEAVTAENESNQNEEGAGVVLQEEKDQEVPTPPEAKEEDTPLGDSERTEGSAQGGTT